MSALMKCDRVVTMDMCRNVGKKREKAAHTWPPYTLSYYNLIIIQSFSSGTKWWGNEKWWSSMTLKNRYKKVLYAPLKCTILYIFSCYTWYFDIYDIKLHLHWHSVNLNILWPAFNFLLIYLFILLHHLLQCIALFALWTVEIFLPQLLKHIVLIDYTVLHFVCDEWNINTLFLLITYLRPVVETSKAATASRDINKWIQTPEWL